MTSCWNSGRCSTDGHYGDNMGVDWYEHPSTLIYSESAYNRYLGIN